MIINYVGKELDNFSVARLWRKYVIYSLKKYFKDKKVLEVGSGIGSFSELIIKDAKSLTMLEPDKNFSLYLKKKFKDNNKVIEIINGTTENIKANKYDAIIHCQVLEHIENDQEEITRNLNLLNKDGYLLICVPSFMSLYSNFDKSIGHYRRYTKKDFLLFNLQGSKIEKMFYLDSSGYLIYKIFKLLLNSSNPKKFMVYIWDKIFIPITFVLDKFLNDKFGKNLVVIVKKI